MNAKNLTIATAYALCLGFILIFLMLQLPGVIAVIIGGSGYLFRYLQIRRWKKVLDNVYKCLSEDFLNQRYRLVDLALRVGNLL